MENKLTYCICSRFLQRAACESLTSTSAPPCPPPASPPSPCASSTHISQNPPCCHVLFARCGRTPPQSSPVPLPRWSCWPFRRRAGATFPGRLSWPWVGWGAHRPPLLHLSSRHPIPTWSQARFSVAASGLTAEPRRPPTPPHT